MATRIYINHLLADEKAPIHAYLFSMTASQDVQTVVEGAISDIKSGKHKVPGSPNKIKWKHYSYIAFILEDPSGKLTHVDFFHETTKMNHTFEDETPLHDFGNGFSGVYYLNTRKDKDGKPLGNKSELYTWKAHHTHGEKRRAHENSGTNVGP